METYTSRKSCLDYFPKSHMLKDENILNFCLYSCGHKYTCRDTLTCNLYEMVLICFA